MARDIYANYGSLDLAVQFRKTIRPATAMPIIRSAAAAKMFEKSALSRRSFKTDDFFKKRSLELSSADIIRDVMPNEEDAK